MYRWNYETFSSLQRSSDSLADGENCVQIHASFLKLVKIDQKMRSRIWRFAVAPSDAAEKTQYIGAQLHNYDPNVHNSPIAVSENLLPV